MEDVLAQVQFKWGETSFTLFPPSYTTQSQYAAHLRSMAIRSVCAHRADYPPDVFKMQLDSITLQFASKKFSWGSQVWAESLDDEENSQKLAYLTLIQDKPGKPGEPSNNVGEEWVAEIWNQDYKDEGDLYYQRTLALGIQPTYGGKLTNAILGFMTRPNSSTPPPAGRQSNSASPSSAPTS